MPTSTATLTTAPRIPRPVKPITTSTTTTTTTTTKGAVTTLRSLYPRAARAFLQRNVALTHSLLLSAFSTLEPPPYYAAADDPLSSHRRKWDLLRITLETTLYTAPLPQQQQHGEPLPEALRSMLAQPPPALLAAMHARSLALFTPAGAPPSAAHLPAQILVALALAAVKLSCVQAARELIEDWLARRGEGPPGDDPEGREKVLEMYTLHVLPRLDDWAYAREVLRCEDELPPDRTAYLVQALEALHTQHLEEAERARRRVLPSPSSSRTATPRPHRTPSPSPSSASTSSTSTHTVVPRPQRVPSPLTSLTPTPRAQTPRAAGGAVVAASARGGAGPLRSTPSAPQMPVAAPAGAPPLLALLRTSLVPHLTAANATFVVLLFLVPLVSFVLRVRRGRLRLRRDGGGSAGDVARWRLQGGLWGEIRRAVVDTVRMAGGGLV